MSSRLYIWARPGDPLKQSDWEANGFDDLSAYIESLEKECERGYQKQGLPEDTGSALDLVTFGYFDPDTGEKAEVLTCANYEELPTESLTYELEGAEPPTVEIVTFIND